MLPIASDTASFWKGSAKLAATPALLRSRSHAGCAVRSHSFPNVKAENGESMWWSSWSLRDTTGSRSISSLGDVTRGNRIPLRLCFPGHTSRALRDLAPPLDSKRSVASPTDNVRGEKIGRYHALNK